MHRYHCLGKVPRKRHSVFYKDSGDIHHEELKGNKGFEGASSLLYHLYPPTRILQTRFLREVELVPDSNPSVKMRHLRSAQLSPGICPILDRQVLLFNNDVVISVVHAHKQGDFFYRNGQADEVVYVSHGKGVLETAFGSIAFSSGDYLIIPRGILHRYQFTEDKNCFFITESAGEVTTPHRYRNEFGQLTEMSPFSERDFRIPQNLETFDDLSPHKLIVKQRNSLTEVTLDHHPFDLVGWDGYYYPYAISIHDFEPIVGRYHLPPPVHQCFEGKNFVICSFCPRPYDFAEDAVPAPYHHSNVMSDEVIYYAKANFMSRKGVEYGSVTLHPDGITHGPHPGRMEASIGQKYTEELAVMVDTFHPLFVSKSAMVLEDEKYERSWIEETEQGE